VKVNILTARNGGPLQWGKDLARILDNDCVKARHTHVPLNLITSCLYQDADIVHSMLPIPFRLWRKPIVVTVLGDYTIEPNMWQRFYSKTIDQADIVTIPSQRLRQKLNLEKAIVIPNAVFPERFEPVIHEYKNNLELTTIMNFYFPNKARGLLDIVKVLDRIGSCFEYTVVGDGTYLNEVKHQIAETKTNIHFTGFLSNLRPTLTTSDIFLYYSHHDVFPTVILEAMASGLPVVTNNIGAVSEIIDNEKDGYVAENDDDYLKYLMNLLGDHELRQKIGQNARAKVEKEFNWYKVAKQFTQLYTKL